MMLVVLMYLCCVGTIRYVTYRMISARDATAVVPAVRLRRAVRLDGPVVVDDLDYTSIRAAVGRDRPRAVPRSVDERGSRPHSLDGAIRVV